jgi:hypothetical protein
LILDSGFAVRRLDPHPLSSVEEKAVAAKNNAPETVRAFTDEVFERSLFAGAAPSIKDRLFVNEHSFRHHQGNAIAERDIAAAFNNRVGALGLPAFMSVGVGQISANRNFTRMYVRSYAGSDGGRGEPPVGLSPAEAVVVTASLVMQKVSNSHYQVEPAEWGAAEAWLPRAALDIGSRNHEGISGGHAHTAR